MPSVKLDDIPLYYEVYGKGSPLLLIGGLGSDSASWLGVAKGFSPYFQAIVFDNRGSGRSGLGHQECTIGRMAQDATGLLDLLKIERAHIIGHSMGGYMAQEIAINYPGRIDKLVLESTAPVSSERNNALFKDFYDQLVKEGCSEVWIRKWLPWLFSPRLLADSPFIEGFVKNAASYPYAMTAEGFRGQIGAIASFDARARIGAIKAQTLILEGKDDVLISSQEARALADNIPHSEFKLLDGAAHAIHIENPKLFVDTVLEFLITEKGRGRK
ncbi:MAG: alpha/beta hydrolase [Candidatus Omnitrophica bacterium]|nr:alpha/beta hydrolase [Candidatus Omnitrophota bacterium]